MLRFIQQLGAVTLNTVNQIGRAGIMLWNTLIRRPSPRLAFPLLVQQLFAVGVLSLVIVVVSGAFIGMVVALQGYHTLAQFGADSALGSLLALSVVRELGPVVTGLLVAGRAGSALTAEIGLMKATEQLSSMAMIGVDPLWRVIAPRFWAMIICMPLLTVVFITVAIFGGYFLGVDWLGVDHGTFWSNMQAAVEFKADLLNGLLKSAVFGIAVAWIAVYQGFDSEPTAEGIGRATTRTVVYSSLAILGLDLVLTAMMMNNW